MHHTKNLASEARRDSNPTGVSRRNLLTKAAAGAAGAGAMAVGFGAAASPAGAIPGQGNPDLAIWGMNFDGVVVPSDRWTPIPWPNVLLNSSPARLADDGYTWIYPKGDAAGIWGILVNLAWDNALSPSGDPIAPPTHRKLVRIPQADTGVPQRNFPACTAASTEVVYHADLAKMGDQLWLSDGTRGYQQQQVYIQAGMDPARTDQRVWIEVYQNSGMDLKVAFDGNWFAQPTADRLGMWALQSPSMMVAYLTDFGPYAT
jgi:hypothetical protein